MPNRTFVIGFAFAVVAMSLNGTRLAAQSPSVRADSDSVVSLEHTWLAAGDSATLERILAPDFLHPVLTGDIIDKPEHIAFVAGIRVRHPCTFASSAWTCASTVRQRLQRVS